MISVTGVSHALGGSTVLHDIELEIPKGKVTALIGPNGAGKSTLLSLIARLARHRTGRIMVDELEVGACASNTLARRLAILPQSSEIAPRLTIAELVAFGRYPHHLGRPGKHDREKVAEALTLFDLDGLAQRTLDTVSGGQRQRALLAMIFAQDTDYLLLDEPLNNLDIAASRSLMALLQRLAREHGRTVVIVLHDINYACAYADHIVTMKGGQIGPQGDAETLVDGRLMHDVFGTDAAVHRIGGQTFVAV
ncbi:ABC transporter ATP-binding protein [Roseovarius sp. MMSF_3281]|uniref:iron ABC transporter ATP-binding protein n=1 Tax=Roseovarius sp. MMSF_3281 TaxID=3046694 RepID=UPI00273E5473|nr:ATP-binding cassette domain-containing protein [Roseovarius sp. MMSF_3281]